MTVYTESGIDVTKGMVLSAGSAARTYITVGGELKRGTTKTYSMLKEALSWARRRADALLRFLLPSDVQERLVDATVVFAIVEEALADAVVRFVSEKSDRLADGAVGLASETADRKADATSYFASLVSRRIADALTAFATLEERHPDALVYFGTEVSRAADGRAHFIHISDLYKIQQFLAEYIPQLFYQVEWGTVPVDLPAGASKKATVNPEQTFNKAVVFFGRAIKVKVAAKINNAWQHVTEIDESSAGWAIAFLPNNTTEVLMLNTGGGRTLAFVTWWR